MVRRIVLSLTGILCLCVSTMLLARAHRVWSGEAPNNGYNLSRVTYQNDSPGASERIRVPLLEFSETSSLREFDLSTSFSPGQIIELIGEVKFSEKEDPVIQVVVEVLQKRTSIDRQTNRPLRFVLGGGSGSCQVDYEARRSRFSAKVQVPRQLGDHSYEMRLVHGRALGSPHMCLRGNLNVRSE